VSEITSLGLTYSLLTKYTSFIAVLENIRNPSGHAIDRAQPLSLGYGVSNYAVASEPALWVLLTFIALFGLARKRKWA
jgi:Ca-activated chloride channel family protein